MRLLATIALAALLSACAGNTVIGDIPAERLTCPDEPDRPAGLGPDGAVTDEENSTYLRGLRGAWVGCKEDVQWIADFVKERKR